MTTAQVEQQNKDKSKAHVWAETGRFLGEVCLALMHFLLMSFAVFLATICVFGTAMLILYWRYIFPNVNTQSFTQLLLWINPFQLLSFRIGSFTVFLSPMSLCPWLLPDWFPFKKSYVGVAVMDLPVSWPDLLLKLHVYPSVFVSVPPLTSLHRLSSYTLSLTLVSVSIVGFPLELVGVHLYLSLWSLLTGRLSQARVGPVLFPGVKSVTEASVVLEPAADAVQISVPFTETDMIIVEPVLQHAESWFDGALNMMSTYGFYVAVVWALVPRRSWF